MPLGPRETCHSTRMHRTTTLQTQKRTYQGSLTTGIQSLLHVFGAGRRTEALLFRMNWGGESLPGALQRMKIAQGKQLSHTRWTIVVQSLDRVEFLKKKSPNFHSFQKKDYVVDPHNPS